MAPPSVAGVAVFSEAGAQRTKWSCIGWDEEGVAPGAAGEFASVLAGDERQLNGPTGMPRDSTPATAGQRPGLTAWRHSSGWCSPGTATTLRLGSRMRYPPSFLVEVWPELLTSSSANSVSLTSSVPKVGLEPTPPCGDRILSPAQRARLAAENEANSSIQRSLAPSVRHDTCQTDPDLARIVDAWPELPQAVKAGIVAMVKAASIAGEP